MDLNGDGHKDLVLAAPDNISVSMGRGNGTFVDTINLPPACFPCLSLGVTVADFNGDGKLDIAAPDLEPAIGAVGTLIFYAGNGDGTFQNPTDVALPFSLPSSLASGDFNGDGKQDLLIGTANEARIAYGNGDGTFQLDLPSTTSVYSSSQFSRNGSVVVVAADMNGDGKIDAVTADFTTGILQIVLNGSFGKTPPSDGIFSYNLSPGLGDIAVGDLNGDGIPDAVVTNFSTNQITIVLSTRQ